VSSQEGLPGSKESDDGGELHLEMGTEVVIGNESSLSKKQEGIRLVLECRLMFVLE
jgi:hypothetical protein